MIGIEEPLIAMQNTFPKDDHLQIKKTRRLKKNNSNLNLEEFQSESQSPKAKLINLPNNQDQSTITKKYQINTMATDFTEVSDFSNIKQDQTDQVSNSIVTNDQTKKKQKKKIVPVRIEDDEIKTQLRKNQIKDTSNFEQIDQLQQSKITAIENDKDSDQENKQQLANDNHKQKGIANDDEDFISLDTEEEMKLAKNNKNKANHNNKKKKEPIVKKEIEKNEDIINRLKKNSTIFVTEEDEEDAQRTDATSYNLQLLEKGNKKRQRGGQKESSRSNNNNFIKCGNKLLGNISTCDPLPEIQECHEEEYQAIEDLTFDNKPRQKKDINYFFNKINQDKQILGLISDKKANEQQQMNQEDQIDQQQSKLIMNEDDQLMNQGCNEFQNSILIQNQCQLTPLENVLPSEISLSQQIQPSQIMQQKSEVIGTSQFQDPTSSSAIQENKYLHPPLKKEASSSSLVSLNRQNSNELPKFLNSSIQQIDPNDQNSQIELDILVPNMVGSNSITNNTLFLNKLSRHYSSSSQGILRNREFSFGEASQESDSNKYSLAFSQVNPRMNRHQYIKQMQDLIKIRKSKNITLEDVVNRCQQTGFDQLCQEVKKQQIGNSGDQNEEDEASAESPELIMELPENEEDKQKEEGNVNKEESGQDQDEKQEVDSGEEELDSEIYEKQINNKNQENNELKKENSEKKSSNSDNSLPLDSSYMNNILNKNNSGEQTKEEVEKEKNDEQEFFDQLNNRKQMNLREQNFQKQLNQSQIKESESQLVQDDKDKKGSTDDLEQEQQEYKIFKKLRNVAKSIKEKQQKKEEIRKQKEQKRLEREKKMQEIMNDPELRKQMEDMLEEEAEQGSDNEEHDDVVKAVDKEAELREAGLEGLDLDADLEDLINNKEEILNDDNEQFAYNKFLQDLLKKDKEQINMIIEGSYKGAQKRQFKINYENQATEEELAVKRFKRMEDMINQLEERDNDAYNYDKDGTRIKSSRKNQEEHEEDDEEKQIQLKIQIQKFKKDLKKHNSREFNNIQIVDQEFIDLVNKNQNQQQQQQHQPPHHNYNYAQPVQKSISSYLMKSTSVAPKQINKMNQQIQDNIKIGQQLNQSFESSNKSSVMQEEMAHPAKRKIIPEHVKPNQNLFNPQFTRCDFMSKNSIIQMKQNKNVISLYNGQNASSINNVNQNSNSLSNNEFVTVNNKVANKDIENLSYKQFYATENDNNNNSNSKTIGNHSNKANNNNNLKANLAAQPPKKFNNVINPQGSSLNKFFSTNQQIANRPSPNKLMIFGIRNNKN